MLVKSKVDHPPGPFARAIRTLRTSLGISQEQAARRLGVTLGAWQRWESGAQSPRRLHLEKIAALPPDPKARITFWLDIYLGGIKLDDTLSSGARKMLPEDAELIRSANTAVESVKLLVLSAARGSRAAREDLKKLAHRLRQAAGKYHPAPRLSMSAGRQG